MVVVDAETHRPVLEHLISQHSSRAVDLIIVEDIASWASSRKGDLKTNPPAMAVLDGRTGGWGILLRRSIDEPWVASILDGMHFRGFRAVREQLTTPELFLEHTVLHELAHLENNWGQEREADCDRWAFERLRRNAI